MEFQQMVGILSSKHSARTSVKKTQHCENSALSNVNLIPGIRFRARNGGRSRQLLVAMASGNLLLDD